METVYDWLTVMLFAGLIVLFLQRSSSEDEPRDSIWQYLIASAGCALVNWVGNDRHGAIDALVGNVGRHLLAVTLLVAVLAYVHYVLRPFDRTPRP